MKHFALFGSSRVRRSMVGRFGVGYDRGLTMELEVVCLDERREEIGGLGLGVGQSENGGRGGVWEEGDGLQVIKGRRASSLGW